MLLSWVPVKCREAIWRITVIGGEEDIWYWDPFMELAFGLHNLGRLREVVFGLAIMPWKLDKMGGVDEHGHTTGIPKQFKGIIGDMWFAPAKRKFPEWKEPRCFLGRIRNDVQDGAESLLAQECTPEERWNYWKRNGAYGGEIDRVCNSFEELKKKCKDEKAIEEATVTVESLELHYWHVCTCYRTDAVLRAQCKCRKL